MREGRTINFKSWHLCLAREVKMCPKAEAGKGEERRKRNEKWHLFLRNILILEAS